MDSLQLLLALELLEKNCIFTTTSSTSTIVLLVVVKEKNQSNNTTSSECNRIMMVAEVFQCHGCLVNIYIEMFATS